MASFVFDTFERALEGDTQTVLTKMFALMLTRYDYLPDDQQAVIDEAIPKVVDDGDSEAVEQIRAILFEDE